MSMLQLTCLHKAAILKAAANENFWGKRLRKNKLALADAIIKGLELKQSELESGFLVDWLDENRPTRQAKASHAKQAQEDLEPTMQGDLDGRKFESLDDGLYIVTAGQNNTTPHAVLKTLETVAKYLNAELLIMPVKYTTTLQGLERKKPTYHADVKAHLMEDVDTWLGGEGCVLLANSAQVLPTAKQPINMAESLNMGESLTIVASPRRQTKTLARQKNGAHRWAVTTGMCTNMHYTDSRAGAEAMAEHYYGGYLVKVVDGFVTHRRLVSDASGVIIDENTVYFPSGEIKAYNDVFSQRPAVVLGDLHCEKMCPDSWSRAVHWASLVQPSRIFVHDALDFMSRNHHNREDWTFLYAQGNRAVIDDLADVINHLNELAEIAPVYIVESNHDLALDSWLRDSKFDIRKDPVNARTYHALKLAYIDALDGGTFNATAKLDLALVALADQLPELSDQIEFGVIDHGLLTYGYDCTMHGHVGTGGARGSAQSFKKMRIKSVTGHTHSPFENGDTVVVGVTGSMNMGYNKGGTSWDRANAIVNPNGTHQLVPMYAIGEEQF